MPAADLHARLVATTGFRILGLDLLPLTLGHVQVMTSIDCLGARDPAELCLALLVCSRPWREAMPFLQSPDFDAQAKAWGEALGEWDFEEKRADFNDYLRANMEVPKVVVLSRDGGSSAPPSPIPGHQTLRVLLLSRLGYSSETVNDTLYLQAVWDALTLRAMEGSVTVSDMSEEELESHIAGIDVDAIMDRFKPKEEACSV